MFPGAAVLAFVLPAVIGDLGGFHWEGRLAAGQSIEICNVHGSIRAEASRDGVADVGSHQWGARVMVTENAGGVRFQVVQTGDEPASGTDFVVHVPKGVRFVGRTVNGSVKAEALQGDAAGYTVNGDVRISATGESRAMTVNGSIEAEMRDVHSQTLELSTVNGGIVMAVPGGVNATFRAHTARGRIDADFPVKIEGHGGERQAIGQWGQGGAEFHLETVNGNIRVRRL